MKTLYTIWYTMGVYHIHVDISEQKKSNIKKCCLIQILI
jgi:hypothetical protein